MQLLSHRLQGPESPIGTYIANLPVGITGIPMFFPREAIAAIEYPPVSEQVKKRCKWLFEFSKELANLPGTPDDPFSATQIDINAMGEEEQPGCLVCLSLSCPKPVSPV